MIGRRWLAAILTILAGLAVLAGCASVQPVASSEVRALLAPSGKLRVGLYPGTPTSILQDSGAPRGVGYELGREFARRLGVPFEPVVFAKNADVLAAIKAGAVDVGFTNASAACARDMDFTRPYLDIELGYLAAPKSPLRELGEIDRAGIRVAVTERSSSDEILSASLRQAVVVRATTVKVGIDMLADGRADVYATNKATLFEMADALPGARVLEGNWGYERHALALPKGRSAGLPFAEAFVVAAMADGTVQSAITRAGLRGASVARAR